MKTAEINLRVSPEQKEYLRQKAAKHGMSMSKYIRRAALGWDTTDPEETEGLGDK